MFKRTLIALALASATLTAHAAPNAIQTGLGDLLVTPNNISAQSLNAAKTVTIPAVNVKLDADYNSVLINGAKMIITVSGAVFNSGITAGDAVTGEFTTTAEPINAGNTLTYIIAGAGTIADGDIAVIPALPVILDSASGSVTYAVSFTTSAGAPIAVADAASAAVATVTDEWSVKFTGLDAQIDVGAGREKFTNGATTDAIVMTFSDVDAAGGAVINTVDVSIDGDFSDIKSVSDGTNVYTINTDEDEATFTYTAGSAVDLGTYSKTITLSLNTGDDAVAMTERTFTASVDVKYDTTKVFAVASGAAAGGFTLNASSITMNYVPMGPNTQFILNATSSFAEKASIDVTYLSMEGKNVVLTDVADVEPGTVTKLGDVISTAVLDDMDATKAKTKITVSVNAPDGDVTFFAGFKDLSDGSRMALTQVDVVANSTLAAALGAQTDLANAADGLGALKTAVTAGNLTSSDAATNAAASLAVAFNTGAAGTVVAADLAIANAICDTVSTGYISVLADADGVADGAVGGRTPIAAGNALTILNVCAAPC